MHTYAHAYGLYMNLVVDIQSSLLTEEHMQPNDGFDQ